MSGIPTHHSAWRYLGENTRKLEQDFKIETKTQSENSNYRGFLGSCYELFQRNKSTISRHIKNIFESGELQADSVVAYFATTASDKKHISGYFK